MAMGKAIALPLHRQGVEGEQRVGEKFAHAREILDALSGLNRAQHAGYRAQHTHHSAGLNIALRRGLRKQAAIARRTWHVGHQLTAIATDAAHRICLAQHYTGIVYQILGGEIISAVDHEVVGTNQVEGIGLAEISLVCNHLYIGIDGLHTFAGHFYLGPAHIAGAVQHLALQIGDAD